MNSTQNVDKFFGFVRHCAHSELDNFIEKKLVANADNVQLFLKVLERVRTIPLETGFSNTWERFCNINCVAESLRDEESNNIIAEKIDNTEKIFSAIKNVAKALSYTNPKFRDLSIEEFWVTKKLYDLILKLKPYEQKNQATIQKTYSYISSSIQSYMQKTSATKTADLYWHMRALLTQLQTALKFSGNKTTEHEKATKLDIDSSYVLKAYHQALTKWEKELKELEGSLKKELVLWSANGLIEVLN